MRPAPKDGKDSPLSGLTCASLVGFNEARPEGREGRERRVDFAEAP